VDNQRLEGVRVLLVEDSYDTRESIRIWLKQHGADVTAVGTCADALEALTRTRPHVLLSDIGLPGEDGYSLLRSIRARDGADGGLVPAAAISAYTSSEHRIKAIMAGFWDYIPKPIDLQLLVAVVANLVHAGAAQPAWTTKLDLLDEAKERADKHSKERLEL
jgi:DNA-binding response OmpR family regulator